MGTVATLHYTAVGVSGGSRVLDSGGWCDIKQLHFDFVMVALLLQRVSVADTEAYLAVARMCSYLGDHRTDRTSALCPTDRRGILKPSWEFSCNGWKMFTRCSHVHWPCRTWIFAPDFKSQRWTLGCLVPTENVEQIIKGGVSCQHMDFTLLHKGLMNLNSET